MNVQPKAVNRSVIAPKGQVPAFLRGLGRFVGEFAVMCAAMCMGGALLALLTFQVLSMAGFAELSRQVPELTIVILAVAITLPMTAYMQIRKHPVRHNLEMSGASLAAGLLVLVGYWLGVVPRSVVVGTGIFGLMCGVMCMAMLLDMLIRAGHYTGGPAAGRHAAAGQRPSQTA